MREEKVMHRCEARTLSRVVESSQLVMPQREVPVASFHIGAGALQHLREFGGLLLQPVWRSGRQCTEGPTGRKERGAQALGQRAKRLARCHCPRRGHAREIL